MKKIQKIASLILAICSLSALAQSNESDTKRRVYFSNEDDVVFKVVENSSAVIVEDCRKGNYRFRDERQVYSLVNCNQFVRFPKAKLAAAIRIAEEEQLALMNGLDDSNGTGMVLGGTFGAFGAYAVFLASYTGGREWLFNRDHMIKNILRSKGITVYGSEYTNSLRYLRQIGLKNRVSTLVRSRTPLMLAMGAIAGGLYWGANGLSRQENLRMMDRFMEMMGVYTAVFGIEKQQNLTTEVSSFSSGAVKMLLQEFQTEL